MNTTTFGQRLELRQGFEDFHDMKNLVTTWLGGLLITLCISLNAQSLIEKRSTLSSGTNSAYSNKILQSVGQQGPIGTGNSGSLTIYQGFVQPSIFVVPNKDSNELNGITVFPNPFSSVLKLRKEDIPDGKILITVLNLSGQEVRRSEKDFKSEVELNLQSLEAGPYILKLTMGLKSAQFKVLKTR